MMRSLTLGAGIASTLLGCGSGPSDYIVARSVAQVELQSDPAITYDAASGKTTVLLDFLLRDAQGASVDPATTKLQRLVNGKAADVESVPNFLDTTLASNLRLGMVLDASYSMTQWSPPAFEPMKKAALDTEETVRKSFATGNAGTFGALVSWFQDQVVCSPAVPVSNGLASIDIPAPKPGDSTKLYAATARMVDRMKALYDAIPAPSTTDHFSMIVFTDGDDNYSWHDDSSVPSYAVGGNGVSCGGTTPMTLSELTAKIKAFPALRVHVIGLGNVIKGTDLSAIATAGRGRFVSNPDPSKVSTLFSQISRELTTSRRDGITMPLPPGDYDYVEEVTLNGMTARVKFKFHAGDAGAGMKQGTLVVQ